MKMNMFQNVLKLAAAGIGLIIFAIILVPPLLLGEQMGKFVVAWYVLMATALAAGLKIIFYLNNIYEKCKERCEKKGGG